MQFSIFDKKNQQANSHSFVLPNKNPLTGNFQPSTSAEFISTIVRQLQDSDNHTEGFRLPENPAQSGFIVILDEDESLSALKKSLAPLASWSSTHVDQVLHINLSALSEETALLVIDACAILLSDTHYSYNACKKDAKDSSLTQVAFSGVKSDKLNELLNKINIRTQAMDFVRDLANAPANICTPKFLADTAKQRAETLDHVEAKIHNQKAIEQIGMGSFLSVAKGSDVEPYFIELHYQGGQKDDAPIVLVGKGITFDSGGISLKPGLGMDEMKYDMCGAGTVLGTFFAVAELKLPINLITLVPTCENMPSGHANKPGDIVKSLKGISIEVLNTDAEGRLILCDALTYAERFKPKAVIDVATLTGACIIALGHVASGVITNHQALADALLDAGKVTDDKAWQLPLFDEYQEQLKSNFADVANIGGRPAGTITAGAFLSRFTEEYHWAHLDIAGTAWRSGGKDKGATARPVPLLLQYLIQVANG